MNKYHELRNKVARVQKEVIGMFVNEAIEHIEALGLRCRCVMIDVRGQMVTADVRSERIGLTVEKDIVTATENG